MQMPKTQATIGELLRRHRRDALLTQKELERLIGYDDTVISRVENDNIWPEWEYIKAVITVLQLSDADLQEIQAVYRAEQVVTATSWPTQLLKRQLREDWGEAPDVNIFYGRQAELARLIQWIVTERCRLVGILGMGGIGKTALTTKLAKQVQDQFDYLIWRSLRNAPPITDFLGECIQFLSDHQQGALPKRTEKKISLIINYLREHRCLLILDNAEAILQKGDQAGYYKDGYEWYGYFLKRLGESEHQSCLVLTSREKPKEFTLLEGESSPVRTLELAGLGKRGAQSMLQDKGLHGSDKAWRTLINSYSGNPLALKLVSETVREVFDGDIAGFLKEDMPIFGGANEVLDQQFSRCQLLEQRIMVWLAIEREATSPDDLHKNLIGLVSKRKLMAALTSLRRRSLIEKSASGFTLQNVVMEYLTDQLIEQSCDEIKGGVIDFLNNYALIKAQAKEYVRESQVRLILKPIAISLSMVFKSQEAISQQLMQILSEIQDKSPREPGYAAGNVLNLLCYLKYDLSGYNLSHLAIRQAYLQGFNLHKVDFSYVDFTECIFTETFGSILSIAFSPDGKLLAAGSSNGEVRIWQVTDDKQILSYQGHLDWVWSVAFSPNSNVIASSDDNQMVHLWSVSTGQCLNILHGHTDWVRAVAFNSDGNVLATASDDQTVRLWDLSTGKCFNTLEGHTNWVRSLAFSPSGRILASGCYDQTVRLWDTMTGECLKTFKGHTDFVGGVAFSPDDDTLASASHDHTVRLWQISTGTCLKTLRGHLDEVYSVAFSPDGSILASAGNDRIVRLWDVNTSQCLRTLQGHVRTVWSIVFSPDSWILASGGDDQTIRLWNVSTGRCFKTLQGYSNPLWSVAFNPNGRILASGGTDPIIRLWDVSTGQCIRTLSGHNHRIESIVFSPHGDILASSSDDQTIRLWDFNTGNCLKTLYGHTNRVWSVAFSPDAYILASASHDKTIRLWDVSTGQCTKTLQGHTNWIRAVTFNPSGDIVASASDDNTIRLWNVSTGQCLRTLEGHTNRVRSIAFSPKGSLMVSGSEDETIRLWDVSTGQCSRILQGHKSPIWAVVFSADSSVLASSSEDKTIRLWDVDTGQCWKILEGHTGAVRPLAFAPDGLTLASGSDDETVRLWAVRTGECLGILRGDRPYEHMNITGVTGLTEAQKTTLRTLGAIEDLK